MADPNIDMIGYQRSKVNKNHLISSDHAALLISTPGGDGGVGAKQLNLVQNSQLAYQHRVMPRFEGGSSELYWISGQAVGTMQSGRVIGNQGFMNQVQANGRIGDRNQGQIKKAALSRAHVELGQASATGVIASNMDITILEGCMMDSVALNYNVGGLEVGESFSMQVARVRKN